MNENMVNERALRWTNGLGIVAALWLVFSPIWISYSSTGNRSTQVVIGVIVGLAAIARLMAPHVTWPAGLNFVAGLWVIAAPWVLASTTADKWNQVVLGVIVAGLALLDLTAAAETEPETAADMSARESQMGFGEQIPRPRDRTNRR